MHAIVDDLCARYRIDLAPMADQLCMNWDEITELDGDPLVTIGAHTVNHAMLSKASDEAVRREIEEGRRILETRLGRPVQHLAYPYGGRDLAGSREFAVARELGFKTAVTTRPGVLFPGHAAHLTALPRISLNGEYEQERFVKVLLSGAATALFNAFRKVDAV